MANARENIAISLPSFGEIKYPISKLLKKGHEEWKKIDEKKKALKAKQEAEEKAKSPANKDEDGDDE